jgi:hypothetical protein
MYQMSVERLLGCIVPSRQQKMTVHEQKENLEEAGPGPCPSVPIQKATGPRTSAGKERSKRNALKHGIFCKAALLPEESRTEFACLLKALRADYQLQGARAEILIEMLAVLYWRYRRLLIAEVAEIRRGRVSPYEQGNQETVIVVTREGTDDQALMEKIIRPQIPKRQHCALWLKQLKLGIEDGGFDNNRDMAILTKLYGQSGKREGKDNLLDKYRQWLSAANCSENERGRNGSLSPDECVKTFLAEVEHEIMLLEREESIESEYIQLEALRLNVPDGLRLERLLRYDTTLARNIVRVLGQLEHLQRMRLGQPVLPKLEVSHIIS